MKLPVTAPFSCEDLRFVQVTNSAAVPGTIWLTEVQSGYWRAIPEAGFTGVMPVSLEQPLILPSQDGNRYKVFIVLEPLP